MKRTIRLTALIAIIFGFFGILGVAEAQAPTLDPEQTVNLATGRMGFSLPLGTVYGVNGHDFPVNLNYQSGILTSQQASQVGLGFEYGAGSITRKVVTLPDDGSGGGKYIFLQTKPQCSQTFWQWFISFVLGILSGQFYNAVGATEIMTIANVLTANFNMVMSMMNQEVKSGPNNYIGGGGGLEQKYDFAEWDKKGFFKGGEGKDFPDIYFVNTPFLSGTIFWAGDKETGHFAFQLAGNNITEANSTIRVKYFGDIGVEKFVITTTDGTRLIFDKTDRVPYHYKSFWSKYMVTDPIKGSPCEAFISHKQCEAIPLKWHLTRVLFNDYQDGDGTADDDPMNSLTTNKGNWISFDYSGAVDARMFRPDKAYGRPRQDGPYSCVANLGGVPGSSFGAIDGEMDGVTFYDLVEINTPNQSAVFEYTNDRLDNLWYTGLVEGTVVFQNVLRKIKIKSHDGSVLRTIEFETGYVLRPGSETAVAYPGLQPTGNPDGRSLTLSKINITGKDGVTVNPIVFEYGFNPNARDYEFVNGFNGYDMSAQRKDVFGYYNPNTPNYGNGGGDQSRAIIDGQVQAAAWSLESIRLPNDMTIEWDYESNKYDRANGAAVEGTGGGPKYLGGIRVKQMTINDGIQPKPLKVSYFYTSANGIFDETRGGCSGYASGEPFNQATSSVDYRRDHPKTFGGIYTATQVAYEKVQVVKDYQNTYPYAPYGYTVYEYTHGGDPGVPGFHPNGGTYGDVDSSWMRGYLINTSVRRKNNALVSRVSQEMVFTEQGVHEVEPTTYLLDRNNEVNYYSYVANKFTLGWPRVTKITSTYNGVKSEKVISYAPDVSESVTPDWMSRTITSAEVIYPWESTYQLMVGYNSGNEMGCFARTKIFGNAAGIDYLIATPFSLGGSSYAAILKIGVDLPSTAPSDWWNNYWASHSVNAISLRPDHGNIIGVGAYSVSNVNRILLLTCCNACFDVGVECLPNIQITNSNVTWDNSIRRQISLGPPTSGNSIVSAAIGDVNNNTIPDIFFLEGKTIDPGNPSVNRRIFAVLDYTLPVSNPVVYVSNLIPLLKGEKISIVDYENDGDFDLEITGRGGILNSAEANYPIHSTVLKNISISGNQLTFSGDSPLALTDYFCLGPERRNEDNGIIEPETDYRYLGMSEVSTSSANINEKKVFAVVRPYEYLYLDYPDMHYPSLSIIKFPITRLVFGDIDGQPNRITETNSNGTRRITVARPGYFEYSGMRSKNMLSQLCQTIVYEKAKDDNTPLSPADIRSSQVTTWSPFRGSSGWVTDFSFSWNNQKGDYTNFEFPPMTYPPTDPSPLNPAWQLTSTIVARDGYSSPVETKNAKGISSSTVYRNDLNLPIASIANANFKECGVFTGDYKHGTLSNYWDYDNGWEKGSTNTCELVSGAGNVHFGEKAIHAANDYAAGRNNVIIPGKAYRMSAWVKPVTGRMVMAVSVHYVTGGEWPLVTLSNAQITDPTPSRADPTGNWQLLKLDIPGTATANLDPGKTWIARAWVGNPLTPGSEGYVDDVRFHPTKAQVSSTYYDTKWLQPIISVDANNKPGKKVAYDDFGRPREWWKIDAVNPYTPKLIEEKCYHLMNEQPSLFSSTEAYYKIVSAVNQNMCLAAPGTIGNGGTVNIQTYNWENSAHKWKILPDGCGCFYIVSLAGEAYGIDDPDHNIANTTVVRLWSANSPAQKWRLIPTGDANGSYKIATKANASVLLDVKDGNDGVAPNDIVHLYADWNADNQKWIIEDLTAH